MSGGDSSPHRAGEPNKSTLPAAPLPGAYNEEEDDYYLMLAVEESKKARLPHQFGAVVVKDGKIIARDHNHVYELNDPSAHAEVSALKLACQRMKTPNINGATLYASHEPCIMCFCCAAWAEVSRVVFANNANEYDDSTYGFEGVSTYNLSKKLTKKMSWEYKPLVGTNEL